MATKTWSSVQRGTYAGGTSYTIGDFVTHNGSSYTCISNTTGNLPTDTNYWALIASKGDTGATGATGSTGATGATGAVGLTWKGTYSAGTAYVPNDGVEYNGSSYVCKLASTGNAPTNTTYFDLIAQKGADGAGSGDVTANGTLTADKIILGDGLKVVKTSSKGIVTTLGSDDTSVPTSKAVKDVTDAKALLAGSTSQAFSVSQLEVGNTDTTISRSAAGVIAVEGVVIPSISSTNTITNKRNQPRIVSSASYTTDTGTSLDFSTCDVFIVTAQAGALKFNNPSGTPQHGEKIIIRVKDNGTARALTYDTQYRAIGVTLPTTTVISKTTYLGGIWNTTDTKLDIIAVAQEA